MRALALLAVLTVVALAFAGCSAKPKDTGKSTSSSTSHSATSSSSSGSSSSTASSGTSSSSSSTSTTAAPNHAPTGSISVNVNGTKATFDLNGTDADKDTLVWDLAFGDNSTTNGTTLPATVNHTYNATGNLTASFTVTDGRNATTYKVTVALAGSAAGSSTQDVDASWTPAENPACANSAVPYSSAPGTFAEAVVVPGTIGKAFTASFDSSAAQDHVRFVDASGASVLDVTAGLPGLSWDVAGTVPDGAAKIAFFGCGGLPGEHVVYHAG